jgi:VWA domain-containing protein/aerotolerance regulator-like protein
MTLLNPAGALGLVAVGVLVALHLFGRRRRVIPVGTLFLWKRVPAHTLDRRRRFRPDAVFLARLAILLVLVGGYVRPALRTAVSDGDHLRLVLVLDASASMQAREAAGPRFELARRHARALVAQLVTGDEVMLIVAADRPRVAVAWTSDHVRVANRLETVAPVDTPTRLAPAVELALGQAGERTAEVVVLTDLPRDAIGVPAEQLAHVDWVQIGRTDDNIAIAGLAVDAPAFRPRAATATVLVRNYAHAPRRVVLDARVGDRPWLRRDVELAARGAETVLLTDPPGAGALVVALDRRDALATDDRAFGWIPDTGPLDTLVVTASADVAATFTRIARAVDGRAEVIDPDRWTERAGSARAVVFDGLAPEAPVPALYLAPAPGSAVCPAADAEDDVAVVDWDADHPAVRGIDGLDALTLPRAVRLDASEPGRPAVLAATPRGTFPLLVAGARDGRRFGCLGAVPHASSDDVPLVLLALGVLGWLESAPGSEPVVIETGVPRLVADASETMAHDDGLRIGSDPPVVVAERVGFHRLGEHPVAANLFDEAESDIGRSGDREWPATDRTAGPIAGRAREISQWLYVAAASLLVAEWALWRRRSA